MFNRDKQDFLRENKKLYKNLKNNLSFFNDIKKIANFKLENEKVLNLFLRSNITEHKIIKEKLSFKEIYYFSEQSDIDFLRTQQTLSFFYIFKFWFFILKKFYYSNNFLRKIRSIVNPKNYKFFSLPKKTSELQTKLIKSAICQIYEEKLKDILNSREDKMLSKKDLLFAYKYCNIYIKTVSRDCMFDLVKVNNNKYKKYDYV